MRDPQGRLFFERHPAFVLYGGSERQEVKGETGGVGQGSSFSVFFHGFSNCIF